MLFFQIFNPCLGFHLGVFKVGAFWLSALNAFTIREHLDVKAITLQATGSRHFQDQGQKMNTNSYECVVVVWHHPFDNPKIMFHFMSPHYNCNCNYHYNYSSTPLRTLHYTPFHHTALPLHHTTTTTATATTTTTTTTTPLHYSPVHCTTLHYHYTTLQLQLQQQLLQRQLQPQLQL